MTTERRLSVVFAVVLLSVGVAPNANATNVDNGICALDVTINIASGSKAQLYALATDKSPVYTMTVTGGNWNPINSAACIYPAGYPSIWRTTTVTPVTPNTTGDIVTCDVMLASGSWPQTWSGTLPPDETGSYTLTGTWGAWLLAVTNLSSFVSVTALTFKSTLAAAALPQCAMSSGVTSFSLTGVQFFQNVSL